MADKKPEHAAPPSATTTMDRGGLLRTVYIVRAGVASVITAAVSHATGARVRDLPVSIEGLLAARAA